MSPRISSPKDLWAGIIYVVIGTAMLWIGQNYTFGEAKRMGPGFFPQVLSIILIGLGVITLARAFIVKGTPISTILWKPMFFILLANTLFGFFLSRLGFLLALPILCVVAAAASHEFRFDTKATLGLIGVTTICALVFVKGLGVPMPLVGTWLTPAYEATIGPTVDFLWKGLGDLIGSAFGRVRGPFR